MITTIVDTREKIDTILFYCDRCGGAINRKLEDHIRWNSDDGKTEINFHGVCLPFAVNRGRLELGPFLKEYPSHV